MLRLGRQRRSRIPGGREHPPGDQEGLRLLREPSEPRVPVLKTTEGRGYCIPSGRGRGGLEFRNPGETPKHCLPCVPFLPPGRHEYMQGYCLQPSFSCLGLPVFSIYFLVRNFFPCIKGDLPLILWANLLAIELFPLSPNCVIGGTS